MTPQDWIAIVWALVALWGLKTAIPNWRTSRRNKAALRAKGINGFNGRLATKEVRLQRNLALALVYILALGVTIAMPTIKIWGSLTLSGAMLSLGLLFLSPYLALWSRAERDDGEQAHLELLALGQKRIDVMRGEE